MTAAVLWDMDGTLIDSEDYHWRAWRETMQCEGVPITHEHFLATFGQRNDFILPTWLGADAPPERIQREGIASLPGAAEWIERLHQAGWKQAIASSAPRLNVEAIMHALKLDGAIEAFTASEDVSHGKPDPEVFLVAAQRLGVEPHRAIVVEDAPAGIEAARRAGMCSIGVSRKVRLNADLYVPTLTDLPKHAFDRLLSL
jgi:HAD superfamily hydrolase (TIGR01509 family)